MARFNADFWEIPAGSRYIENTPADRGLWFETEVDRERRHALEEFYRSVMPAVQEFIDTKLTKRQRQVLEMYYFQNMTQEDIAAALNLTQSTVSRHLFGATRSGKKVGGAIPKLRKVIERSGEVSIATALTQLQTRFAQAA